MRQLLFPGAAFIAAVLLVFIAGPALGQEQAEFVGSQACQGCHPDEYENFTTHSKKATSAESVQMMASDLTPAELESCYGCHTTGYGQPGGFVSYEETPGMGDAGCEVCHGPGSLHVEYGGDPSVIKGSLALEDCTGCHNEERVESFDFKPLLYGGAH
ncbi:cytochrome c family protein [Desulfohalovibrio reitneri]|uniref:cytochrome c family protein n=1 Tax=Desulfohalovibrio reitneri TaxID=1307759 RepID=UPI0004A6D9C1|nr:cytochrome c family protein [Desulfohalovibrio reitneri]